MDDLLVALGVVVMIGLIIYMIVNRRYLFHDQPIFEGETWMLPTGLSEKSLADVEGGIDLLQEVIIVAHRLEEPTNELLAAVKRNFAKNVRYRFLISNSSYRDFRESYLKIFEGWAKLQSPQGEELVSVLQLGMEWTDVPYIFYRCSRKSAGKLEFVFGYRGSELGEGIANHYALMGPGQARTILNLIERVNPNILDSELFKGFEFIGEDSEGPKVVSIFGR